MSFDILLHKLHISHRIFSRIERNQAERGLACIHQGMPNPPVLQSNFLLIKDDSNHAVGFNIRNRDKQDKSVSCWPYAFYCFRT